FELTSVEPMRRYGNALRRIGAPAETTRFYDVHVLADAEHERLALDMAAAFVRDEPVLYGDVVLGAAAALLAERHFAETLLAGPVAAAAAIGAVIAA
ncbi:MAG TPA: iron-containing redox enzyme family protein, partial [Acidimicrobiales bacterium]|nr:iron-containing redox enzyme family protein [Acidimicrobiales bacterium]